VRRRSIRLPAIVYVEEGRAFSVTIGTSPRRAIFTDLAFARACVAELASLRHQTSAKIYAYCLMPDHVHLLLGVSIRLSLPHLVGAWKSRCYRLWRAQGNEHSFWQRSYYDHALREEEDLRRAAEYILNNPVRAGLVERFEDYEACGSLEFTL
jgi:REP element-mobilizing transposase RayT